VFDSRVRTPPDGVKLKAASDASKAGVARPGDDKTTEAVLECAGEDLNLHGLLRPLGPQPSASTNSATSARARAV
jgi:hypothetical protein